MTIIMGDLTATVRDETVDECIDGYALEVRIHRGNGLIEF